MPTSASHPVRFGPEREFRSRPSFSTSPVITGISPTSVRASGGATLTLVGQNFILNGAGAGVSVLIDGVAASSVVVVNRQTITCVVPSLPGVGLVDVKVTTPGGSYTLQACLTAYEAVISSLTPAYGPFAGGTSVLIEGWNFDPSAHYTILFGDQPATNVIVIDSQHVRCTTPAHAASYVDIIVQGPSYVFAPSTFEATVFDEAALTPGIYTTLRLGFQFTLLTRGSDIRRQPGIQINTRLGNQGNSADFTIDGTSNQPREGELIEVTDSLDSDRLLFRGTVQSLDISYDDSIDNVIYRAHCIDFTYLLNKYFPVGTYTNVSVSDIVRDAVAKYAPGFTTVHVQSNLARVSISLDGSQNFGAVLTALASAIGGGHFWIDYDQDLHFFHTQPTTTLPPSQFQELGTPMVLSQGSAITSPNNRFTKCYAYVRQTTVYSDGTESQFGAISNVLQLDGSHRVHLDSIQLGVNVGTLTPTKRRIYINLLKPSALGTSKFEDIKRYIEIPDNVTTSYESDFGSTNGNVSGVTDIAATVPIPNVIFNGHPAGPTSALTATVRVGTITTPDAFGNYGANGGAFQFKVANLYRDGSVSFAGLASPTAGINPIVIGSLILGWDFDSIPIGASIGNNDVVARIIYYCLGADSSAGKGVNGVLPFGFVWPYAQKEPDWVNDIAADVVIIPDNTTTSLHAVSLTSIDFVYQTTSLILAAGITPVLVGEGNLPYTNGSVLSSDPIPVWPNNDGPSLEDVNPPDDIDDNNADLLHSSSGAQPVTLTRDMSQLRNRVKVVGSGSVLAVDALAGDTTLQIADVTAYSPSGGQVRLTNTKSGLVQFKKYTGVSGVTGRTFVDLASPLDYDVPQGSFAVNFFQADDLDSQKAIGKIELDKNGNPTDGVHEYTITDPSLKAPWQLYMRAYAELELFAKPILTVRYPCRDTKTVVGQIVHFDLTKPPIQGDFLIQEVAIDQIHDESDSLSPRYTATASSVRYTLTDLLLALVNASNSNAPSNAGLVATAASDATGLSSSGTAIPTTLPLNAGAARRFGVAVSNGAGVDALTLGISGGVNQSGAVSNIVDSAKIGGTKSGWTRYTPLGSNANQDGWQTSATVTWDLKPMFICRFRTAPTLDGRAVGALSDRVYWFGLSNGLPVPGSESFTNLHVALFCSTKFQDSIANFEISIGDGSLQTRSHVGFLSMRPSTHYQAMVKWIADKTALVAVKDLTNSLQAFSTVTLPTPFAGSATTMNGIIQATTGGLIPSSSYIDIGSFHLEGD